MAWELSEADRRKCDPCPPLTDAWGHVAYERICVGIRDTKGSVRDETSW